MVLRRVQARCRLLDRRRRTRRLSRRRRVRRIDVLAHLKRSSAVRSILKRLPRRDRDKDERDDSREEGDPADDEVGEDRALVVVGEVLAGGFDELVDERLGDARGADDAGASCGVVLSERERGQRQALTAEEERENAQSRE